MAHAENAVTINKPIKQVYDFLADGTNNPAWRPGVISISLRSGTSGMVDAEYAQVLHGPGGRKIAGDYRITTANPYKELSFQVIAGPARPIGTFYLSETANGTVVKFVLDLKPKGLAILMEPMIVKTMKGEVSQLSVLKQVIEAA